VVQFGFGKEASQTRDFVVAKSATLRAARLDPSLRKERLLQDDKQTAPLPVAGQFLDQSFILKAHP